MWEWFRKIILKIKSYKINKNKQLRKSISKKSLKKTKTNTQKLENKVKETGNLLTILDDIRERLSKDSKLSITKSERDQMKKIADVVKENKKAFFGNLTHEDIKNKFSLTKSQSVILKNMVADYKKGKKLSTILRQSNMDIDKEELNKILRKFQANKTKNAIFFENIENLKKKMVLSKSNGDVLDKMKEDYKAGKFSLSDIPNISKINILELKLENLNKILAYFKEHIMKKKHVPFIKQSKLKQWKSDIGAKFNSL